MIFTVSYCYDDAEQYAGIKPHDYITDGMMVNAEDENGAIDECIDFLQCAIAENGYTSELIDEPLLELVVYDEYGNVYQGFYNFRAEKTY